MTAYIDEKGVVMKGGEDPQFVMSMYLNKTDLYKAKAEYYMAKSERLELNAQEDEDLRGIIKNLRAALQMFPGFSSEGLIGSVADVYPYRKADFLRMRKEILGV